MFLFLNVEWNYKLIYYGSKKMEPLRLKTVINWNYQNFDLHHNDSQLPY